MGKNAELLGYQVNGDIVIFIIIYNALNVNNNKNKNNLLWEKFLLKAPETLSHAWIVFRHCLNDISFYDYWYYKHYQDKHYHVKMKIW